MAVLDAVISSAKGMSTATAAVEGSGDVGAVPSLVITCHGKPDTADRIIKMLIAGNPSIHTDPFWRHQNKIVINPLCIRPDQTAAIGKALGKLLS
jgi:hypothetical protein